MTQSIIDFLTQFPPVLATFLAAAIPITEIQLALPLGIYAWELSPGQALFWAVLGSALPILPLYFGLNFLRRVFFKIWVSLGERFERWLESAKEKVAGKYEKYGMLGLLLFVALPFPMTGIYTGVAAAVLLEIPPKAAFPAILTGAFIRGVIILLLSLTPDLFF